MKKQKLAIIAALVLVVVAGLSYYAYTQSKKQTPMEEESSRIKERVIDSYNETGTSPGSDQPASKPDVNQDNSSDKAPASIMITASEVYEDRISIRAIVQTVTTSGKCTLNLSKGSLTKTYTSEVQPLPSTTACKGFDVPKSELTSGTWNVEVIFENDNLYAKTSKEIVV